MMLMMVVIALKGKFLGGRLSVDRFAPRGLGPGRALLVKEAAL